MLKKMLFFTFFANSLYGMQKPEIQKKSLLDRCVLYFCCSSHAPQENQHIKQSIQVIKAEHHEREKVSSSQSSISTTVPAPTSISGASQLENSQDFLGCMNAPPSLAFTRESPISSARKIDSFEEIPLDD